MINNRKRSRPTFQERVEAVYRAAATVEFPAPFHSLSNTYGGQRSRRPGGRESPCGRRTWEPRDPITQIDWAASAINVLGELERRVDYQTRQTPTAVLIDTSPSMLFGGGAGLTKLQQAGALAVSLIRSAAAQGDPVEVKLFATDGLALAIPPNHREYLVRQTVSTVIKREDELVEAEAELRRSRRPDRIVRRWLARFGKKPIEQDSVCGLDVSLKRLSFIAPGQLYVISDCVWWGEAEIDALKGAAAYHHARCLLVVDPREMELPRFNWHWHRFAELGTGAVTSVFVTPYSRRRHRRAFQMELEGTATLVRRLNCRPFIATTDLGRTGNLKLLTKLSPPSVR